MSDFNPQKLSVKLIPPATSLQPLKERKYTLTHSDITAEFWHTAARTCIKLFRISSRNIPIKGLNLPLFILFS